MIEQIYERFLNSNIPYEFSLNHVDQILQNKYAAVEVSKSTVEDLKNDPMCDFDAIYKCYIITDTAVLDSLFTEEEKLMHSAKKKRNINKTNLDKNAKTWRDIKEGRMIRVIVDSDNGSTMTGFNLQGLCEVLMYELYVLKGIKPEACTNPNDPYFAHYLECLDKAGYL
ncbi:hypothetical protein PaeCFBP13512_23145 [Paenibacillus sp. CFBP13512]|uniref:hypothetical protein n=1 Tax=Paenibacillus sp. CFBP13512 TaxID=2184007 RepID=UPI0010C14B08|nr:hypothetical protein [Paenibacillus sp. CFBP13512]TKJ83085.1 hypothetical protein PaeCFBP13512_23145 [Paenibacillus sp. CFBP13512]